MPWGVADDLVTHQDGSVETLSGDFIGKGNDINSSAGSQFDFNGWPLCTKGSDGSQPGFQGSPFHTQDSEGSQFPPVPPNLENFGSEGSQFGKGREGKNFGSMSKYGTGGEKTFEKSWSRKACWMNSPTSKALWFCEYIIIGGGRVHEKWVKMGEYTWMPSVNDDETPATNEEPERGFVMAKKRPRTHPKA